MHNILFKRSGDYPEMERELSQLDYKLARILHTFAALVWQMHRSYIVITRIYEPRKDGSTHNRQKKPYRFIDVALIEQLDMEDQERLQRAINILFPYDCSGLRKTIPRLDHGTAPHYHIQVKP